jgi:hypothetical protein
MKQEPFSNETHHQGLFQKNKPKSIRENEFMVKNLSIKKTPYLSSLSGEFSPAFKE